MPTTEAFDIEIRSLITELMESSPLAPALPELESRDPGRLRSDGRNISWSYHRPRLLTMAGGFGAVVAAVLLLVFFLPSVGQRLPVAEAAQLRLIASNAAHQPVLELGPNQWLRTQQVLSLSLGVTHQVPTKDPWGNAAVMDVPIPGATATVRAVSTQWYNNFGQTCVSETLSPVQFESNANRVAWQSAGLSDRPTERPLTSCPNYVGANARNGFSGGIGAVNVSTLTSDPVLLAKELSTGTTGIPGLDQHAPTGNQGFEEALQLLVGPITGKPASFSAEIYQALALIPGIDKLGETTTHTGEAGLGFTADTYSGKSTIIVDPNTGKLLEAQNVPLRAANAAFNLSTEPFSPQNANLLTQGKQVGASVQWVDSLGTRAIVSTSALPSNLKPSPTPVAVIVAAAKPSVGGLVNVPYPPQLNDPVNVLVRQLNNQLGDAGGGSGLDPTPGAEVLTLDFTASRSQVDNWAQALRSSGLFVSVVINWGDVQTSTPGV
jgi:hypothetical protein